MSGSSPWAEACARLQDAREKEIADLRRLLAAETAALKCDHACWAVEKRALLAAKARVAEDLVWLRSQERLLAAGSAPPNRFRSSEIRGRPAADSPPPPATTPYDPFGCGPDNAAASQGSGHSSPPLMLSDDSPPPHPRPPHPRIPVDTPATHGRFLPSSPSRRWPVDGDDTTQLSPARPPARGHRDSETCCSPAPAPAPAANGLGAAAPAAARGTHAAESHTDFFRSPRPRASPGVGHKYREVVRGKSARELLKGHPCQCCTTFYAHCGTGAECPEDLVQRASRHRFADGNTPPRTPDGFWSLSLFAGSAVSPKSPKRPRPSDPTPVHLLSPSSPPA